MQYKRLGETDMSVSILGMGASSLGGVFRSTDDDESKQVVEYLLKSRVNYIDTAPWYGQGRSEQVLGDALRAVPRDSYYVATKVGRYDLRPEDMFDFSYGRTLRSVDESLKRLGLDYVDVIQAHDVEYASTADVVLNETLPALEAVKSQGKARYIGVTGYPLDVLKDIVERSRVKIDVVLTYARYSMNDTTLLQYTDFFKSKGVGIINASPLSMGLLSDRGPPDWHPAREAKPEILTACAGAARYCAERGVDLSRLALKFSLGQPDCATCLVSTASKANAVKNVESALMPLGDHERRVLGEVLEKYMRPLNDAHWEKWEVEKYWESLQVGR